MENLSGFDFGGNRIELQLPVSFIGAKEHNYWYPLCQKKKKKTGTLPPLGVHWHVETFHVFHVPINTAVHDSY